MESSVERIFYDLVIDCNEVRFSALVLESATDEEIEEIRNLAQKITKRWKDRKSGQDTPDASHDNTTL